MGAYSIALFTPSASGSVANPDLAYLQTYDTGHRRVQVGLNGSIVLL